MLMLSSADYYLIGVRVFAFTLQNYKKILRYTNFGESK